MAGERVRITSVFVERLATESGHWCNTCKLSTGVRAWITVRSDAGMHLQNGLGCTECGGRDVTPVGVDDVDLG